MGGAVNVIEDVKTIMSFYEALGVEKLPINTDGFKIQDSGFKNSEFKNPKSKIANSLIRTSSSQVSEQKKSALEALREEIGDCQRCKLSKWRKNIVFGEGNPRAYLMFIGEAPGKEEDIQARPFVGDAGKLLTSLIEKMGFSREDVYIANIVKCRPPLNRDPEEDEIKECLPFIDRQAETISPKIIISLGRISAHTLMGTKVPITKLRGRFSEYRGIPLMPTFHPAYLLRNPKDKQLVWEDAQKVLKMLRS